VPLLTAGLLVYVRGPDTLEVFLVHPGGPFGIGRDAGSWSIPKGLCEDAEEPMAAAAREFSEETGTPVPVGGWIALGELRQPSGKRVRAWAVESPERLAFGGSNTFPLEWPPRSGVIRDYPEVDRAEWFPLEVARDKLLKGQRPFLDALAAQLGAPTG